MKIVILSDLNWEQHLRSVSLREVESIDLERVGISRYHSIKRYLDIVISEKAELVLIAGDVTGDGSCGHGFHNAFLILLSLLDQLEIPTCFISGNHDDPQYYQLVEKGISKFSKIHEISNQSIDINGLKILGVPYETTYSKSKIKKLISEFNKQYDIVLAHAQLKRRIRLFELQTRYIFTGHYDRKLFHFQDSVFISLDNDTTNISYSTLDINDESDDIVTYKVIMQNQLHLSLTGKSTDLPNINQSPRLMINNNSHNLSELENKHDSQLKNQTGHDLIFLKYIRGTQYQSVLQKMMEVKSNPELKPTLTVTESIISKQITANYRVSTSLILDFLGKRTR